MGLVDGKMKEATYGESEGGGEDFTPEQEASLEKFSLACKQALYADGGMADRLAAELAKPEEDGQTMAAFAYRLTAMLDEKSGGMLEDELIAAAAADVLDQVIEVAQAAGAKIGPEEIARATQLMLNRYLEESGASPEDIQQMNAAADPAAVGAAIDKRDNIGGSPAPAGGIVSGGMGA